MIKPKMLVVEKNRSFIQQPIPKLQILNFHELLNHLDMLKIRDTIKRLLDLFIYCDKFVKIRIRILGIGSEIAVGRPINQKWEYKSSKSWEVLQFFQKLGL